MNQTYDAQAETREKQKTLMNRKKMNYEFLEE